MGPMLKSINYLSVGGNGIIKIDCKCSEAQHTPLEVKRVYIYVKGLKPLDLFRHGTQIVIFDEANL